MEVLKRRSHSCFGDYFLEALVHESAMAEVYRAHRLDAPENPPRILKRLLARRRGDPGFEALFAHEQHLAGTLDAPELPSCVRSGDVDGWPFIILEVAPGIPLVRLLAAALGEKRTLRFETTVHILEQVARGLAVAHTGVDHDGEALGLVHMDVAPQNVLVDREARATLIDFGIARSRRLGNEATLLRGRSAYLAPEQLDRAHVDQRADIFAFGTLFHETLFCRPLFRSHGEEQTRWRVAHAPIPRLEDLGPATTAAQDILDRCLARDPSERYQDATELSADLSRLRAELEMSREDLRLDLEELHHLAPPPRSGQHGHKEAAADRPMLRSSQHASPPTPSPRRRMSRWA